MIPLLARLKPEKNTKYNVLAKLAAKGYCPENCIDVGAHEDTTELRILFPTTNHILVEPDQKHYKKLKFNYKNTPHFIYQKLCSNEISEESTTIDKLAENLCKECLIKIDTDGHEIECLQGARETLANEKASVVVIEATYNRMNQIIEIMTANEYMISGICDTVYRGDLFWQCDIVFIKKRFHQKMGAYSWNKDDPASNKDRRFKVGYSLPARIVLNKIKSKSLFTLASITKSNCQGGTNSQPNNYK